MCIYIAVFHFQTHWQKLIIQPWESDNAVKAMGIVHMQSLHVHMQWLHALHRTAHYFYVHSLLQCDAQLSMFLPSMLWVYCMGLFNSWSSSEEKYVPSTYVVLAGAHLAVGSSRVFDAGTYNFFTELQLGRWMIQVTGDLVTRCQGTQQLISDPL